MRILIWAVILAVLLSVEWADAQVTQTATFKLSWQHTSTAQNAEDGFDVMRCSGATCTNFVRVGGTAPDVLTFADSISGDVGNVTYRYQVVAFNMVGRSAPSNTVNITSPALFVIPGAPSGLLGSVVGVTIP